MMRTNYRNGKFTIDLLTCLSVYLLEVSGLLQHKSCLTRQSGLLEGTSLSCPAWFSRSKHELWFLGCSWWSWSKGMQKYLQVAANSFWIFCLDVRYVTPGLYIALTPHTVPYSSSILCVLTIPGCTVFLSKDTINMVLKVSELHWSSSPSSANSQPSPSTVWLVGTLCSHHKHVFPFSLCCVCLCFI